MSDEQQGKVYVKYFELLCEGLNYIGMGLTAYTPLAVKAPKILSIVGSVVSFVAKKFVLCSYSDESCHMNDGRTAFAISCRRFGYFIMVVAIIIQIAAMIKGGKCHENPNAWVAAGYNCTATN